MYHFLSKAFTILPYGNKLTRYYITLFNTVISLNYLLWSFYSFYTNLTFTTSYYFKIFKLLHNPSPIPTHQWPTHMFTPMPTPTLPTPTQYIHIPLYTYTYNHTHTHANTHTHTYCNTVKFKQLFSTIFFKKKKT